jgi:uncharacterized protein YcfL
MKKYTGLLLLVVPVILTGCRASQTSVERAQPVGTAQVVADKRIKTDATLNRKIAIVQVNEGIVSGNLTKVQVLLVNKKNISLTINYAFEWYDTNGMVVNSSGSGWKSLAFAGGEQKAVTAIGPTPQAVDFVLKLQEPRPFFKRHDLNPFNS